MPPQSPIESLVVDRKLEENNSRFSFKQKAGAVAIAVTSVFGLSGGEVKGDTGNALNPGDMACVASNGDVGDYSFVNLTPVRANGAGHLTAHSSNDAAGETSNNNYFPGSVVPNNALVEIGDDGEVCVTNANISTVDLVIDELAILDGSVVSLPTNSGADRLLDTRETKNSFGPGEKQCVASNGDVGDYSFVNLTPVRANGAGHLTAHSSNDAAGETSNNNYFPGSVVPNNALVEIGDDGEVCVTNANISTVDLVIDELAILDGSVVSLPTNSGADRLLDTRDTGNPLNPGEKQCATSNGNPGDYTFINTTPVRANGPGHITAHSSNDQAGETSNNNYFPGSVVPNTALVEIGNDSKVCVTNANISSVDLVLDELAILDGSVVSLPTNSGADRLLDTREKQDVGTGEYVPENERQPILVEWFNYPSDKGFYTRAEETCFTYLPASSNGIIDRSNPQKYHVTAGPAASDYNYNGYIDPIHTLGDLESEELACSFDDAETFEPLFYYRF